MKKEVTDIRLNCNSILEKDLLDDKVGILDIKAKIDKNINCDIEMQVVDRRNIEKRILFYWSKMYNQKIKAGRSYSSLEKGIIILLTDYEIIGLKEIKKYVTKWNIREEEYKDIILTDVMEIYIIELPKFEKYKDKVDNNQLDLWVKFIKNPEVIDMSNKEKEVLEEIKKAKKILEEISQDEREVYLAELREKHILDQIAIEEAGYDKGLKTGIEQGIERGIQQIAKNMKSQKMAVETICQVTGLSKEEIEKL